YSFSIRRLLVLSSLTATPPSALFSLSLHDALPIFGVVEDQLDVGLQAVPSGDLLDLGQEEGGGLLAVDALGLRLGDGLVDDGVRSEEHTSELQSRFDLVCRLLLEKKKKRAYGHRYT